MVENRIRTTTKLTAIKQRASNVLLNVFTYSTVRSATIQSYRVGVVYRTAQLVLLSYIIGFVFFFVNCFKISSLMWYKKKWLRIISEIIKIQKIPYFLSILVLFKIYSQLN